MTHGAGTASFGSGSEPPAAIRWRQVMALLALDVALLLSWMAYNEFQPRLIERYGGASQVRSLLVIQVVILVVTPPMAGYLTDRLLRRGGTRVAVVNLGISLAAMLFMATAVTLSGPPGSGLAVWLPALVVLWLIAMNVFHSPALSMLELYVPLDALPGLAALFTLLSGLAAALEPGLTTLIEALGAPLSFAFGGVVVAASGYWFFRTASGVEVGGESGMAPSGHATAFGLILAIGLGLGAGEVLMSDGLSPWMMRCGDLFPGVVPVWQSSLLYGVAALAAWPLGLAGNRWGAERLALAGALGGISLAGAAWFLPAAVARPAFWIFPVAYAALAVAALPVVFARLRAGHKVLGVGLLFSGIELVTGVADIVSAYH